MVTCSVVFSIAGLGAAQRYSGGESATTSAGMRLSTWLLAVGALAPAAFAVKSEDFKTCSQSSFCRRLRSIATRQAEAGNTFTSPYSVESGSTPRDEASWTFPLKSSLYPEVNFELKLDILAKGDGIARVRVDEVGSKTQWKRYDESARWALLDAEPGLASLSSVSVESPSASVTVLRYGPEGSRLSLQIEHSPLKITQFRAGKPQIILNDRGLFHMEHFRTKEQQEAEQVKVEEGGDQAAFAAGQKIDRKWFEGEPDSELFEERFRKWTDTKPKGPEGYSFDVTFPGVDHIYGLPEHAAPLSLPDTDGAYFSEPYRLWNVDIFEYLASSSMALYGSIPLLHAHSAEGTVGLLSLVASETWVDVLHRSNSVQTHWVSESGIVDLLLLPGPDPSALFKQFTALTGPTPLPPQWATAYHQCRWNYVDQEDVLQVQRRFDEADIPLDVTWLDIEYAEEHRYFDWDRKVFPDPVAMQEEVGSKGRKMVAIVDPHIKRTDSFRVFKEASDLDVLVKRADAKTDFEGWCWTGSSVWVDFFNQKSWSWWQKMFDFSVWKESSKYLFIWNDMNEPSVFDGPEITMGKDNVHAGGWEHRDIHNINGMLFHNQTQAGLIARESPAKRPFVLSRSFYTGSHRYGAIWTGDNLGTWDHLAGETAMLLSVNIGGMTFAGADVGGFFGDPSPEMLVRWYQAGAFMPFFRAHAHIDTKRREPYLFDEPIRGLLRDAIRLRYQLLPVWYNAFREASVSGTPTMRPQYVVFPKDKGGFAIDDQYYLGGSGLLIKPVVHQGATETEVYLSDNQPYYNYFNRYMYPGQNKPRKIKMATPLETFPVLQQGGSILPVRERVRRSSPLMWKDPFTLIVAVGKDGSASGELYLDDSESYSYQQGEFVWRGFEFATAKNAKSFTLRSVDLVAKKPDESGLLTPATYQANNAWAQKIANVRVEKIVVLGLKTAPNEVSVQGASRVEFEFTQGAEASGRKEGTASVLVVKNPNVLITRDWSIKIR